MIHTLYDCAQIFLILGTIFWLYLALTKEHITDSKWPFVTLFILIINLQVKLFFIDEFVRMAAGT